MPPYTLHHCLCSLSSPQRRGGIALENSDTMNVMASNELNTGPTSVLSETPLPPHPSLLFYRGEQQVRLCMTVGGLVKDMRVFQLHQALLPPAAVDLDQEVSSEFYAKGLASVEGLELLRLNWDLLLLLLFPVMKEGDGTASETPMEAGHVIASAEECEMPLCTPPNFEGFTDAALVDRVHYSYVVVLRFFGWRLHDDQRGVLDRHRGWKSRYAALQPDAVESAGGSSSGNLYPWALTRVLRSLLGFGFSRYAVQLVEFMIEEMACQRLVFLQPLVEDGLLPILTASDAIEKSHIKRLQSKIRKLTQSDSD